MDGKTPMTKAAKVASVNRLEDVLPPAAAVLVRESENTPPLPAAPWPTEPKTLEQPLPLSPVTPTPAAHPFDLTDEELERLTAPDGE